MSRLNLNKQRRKSRIGIILCNHIKNNKRGYFIISILFFIGLIIGVVLVNNMDDIKIQEINSYFSNMVSNIKSYENINSVRLLKKSIFSNFITIIFLWFGASTIIGVPIVYGTITLKGFFIGYTISSIIACFGTGKGILISLSIMLLHNIVFVPSIFGVCVSGVKLYQSVMKNKARDNIKLEMLRHTLFCGLMLMLVLLSSILEVYGSTKLFIILLKRI